MSSIIQIYIGHRYGESAGTELHGTEIPNVTAEILRIVSAFFTGATLTPGVGIWKGQTEKCTVVTILDSTDFDWNPAKSQMRIAEDCAKALRLALHQDSVIVTNMNASVVCV